MNESCTFLDDADLSNRGLHSRGHAFNEILTF
jgi:hypothetical protein